MAFGDFEVDCTLLDRRSVTPPSGGVMIVWSDGASFKAAIDIAASGEARTAFQSVGKEAYTIIAAKDAARLLRLDSYFRNERTGAYIRVTDMGAEAPGIAGVSVKQFRGELVGFDRACLPE